MGSRKVNPHYCYSSLNYEEHRVCGIQFLFFYIQFKRQVANMRATFILLFMEKRTFSLIVASIRLYRVLTSDFRKLYGCCTCIAFLMMQLWYLSFHTHARTASVNTSWTSCWRKQEVSPSSVRTTGTQYIYPEGGGALSVKRRVLV